MGLRAVRTYNQINVLLQCDVSRGLILGYLGVCRVLLLLQWDDWRLLVPHCWVLCQVLGHVIVKLDGCHVLTVCCLLV